MFLRAFCLLLACFPAVLHAQIASPERVESGEAIHLQYENCEPGDVIRWEVLNPFPEPRLKIIETKFGSDLICDPPCNWTGVVRVQCIVVGADERVRYIGTKIVDVGKPGVDPDIPPTPTPPDPVEEYDGPNELGVGKVSFDNAPSYNAGVVSIFKSAGNYLKGMPELKVVYTDDVQKNKTDYNVYVWLDQAMKAYPAFSEWYESVMQYEREIGITKGSPLNLHYQFFNEVAAGVEAKK